MPPFHGTMAMKPIFRAKIEAFEKRHFNNLHQISTVSSLNETFYQRDLIGHSDRRMYVNGISKLGNLTGKTVLLFGCGVAAESYYIASRAKKLIGFDIAYNALRRASFGASKYGFGTNTAYYEMSAYFLGIKDCSVDCIYGHAILHHLDLGKAGNEISRILNPGGVAVFAEPLDVNPLLRFARRFLPYPNKHRLMNEKGITYADLNSLEGYFSAHRYYESELFLMLGRLVNCESLKSLLDKLDRVVLAAFPFLKRMCRVIYAEYRK
jgi:SAM-dependent methyltransferase